LGEYKQREWDKAVAGFEKLADDLVSKMYIKRCVEMKANPPGPEWDGVYKMTTK
jgi:adenylate cyclase